MQCVGGIPGWLFYKPSPVVSAQEKQRPALIEKVHRVSVTMQEGQVQLQPRQPGGFQQTQSSGPNGALKVTLSDCLACSGCITSAGPNSPA